MDVHEIYNSGKLEQMTTPKKKKKIPHVKQTLTSKYRILKANPLLMYELGKKIDCHSGASNKQLVIKPLKSLAAIFDADNDTTKFISNSSIETMVGKCKSNSNMQEQHKHDHKKAICNKKINQQICFKKVQHNEKISTNIVNSSSICSPTKKSQVKKAKAADVCVDNSSLFAKKSSVFSESVNNSAASNCDYDVTRKLCDWLKQRGRNMREYNHLKCFGIQNNVRIASPFYSGKENCLSDLTLKNDNYCANQENCSKKINLSAIVEDALLDLHNLILEGYPPNQCEIWLKLIRQKHTQIEQRPQYWECRAALEQSKGNLNLAIQCYKTAIFQGAKVEDVENSLTQLLHKFSLLNISESELYINHDQCKIVEDARNIIKSSIIQFAVQEKLFKKKDKDGITVEKKIIATPVRRSTRLSRCAYTSTPGVQIFASLKDIDTSLRSTLNFQCNNALKDE